MLGCDREDAYRGWYLLGFATNFAACAYALRRLDHGRPAAALGAFLFSFALPMTVQSGHSQLNYRFGVPLAILALVQFARQPRLSTLFAVVFWTVWQFYCSIYVGYFLGLLLIAFAVATALTGAPLGLRTLLYWPRRMIGAWREGSGSARAGFVLGATVLCALMIGLFLPYLRVSKLYGFQRSWAEIALALPRLSSYLLTINSRLWHVAWCAFDALPRPWEHAMFVGVAPVLAIAIAVILRWGKRTLLGSLFGAAALAIGLLAVLTLWMDGYSLYRLVAELPGIESVRYMTRIILVILFPVSMLLASSVDALSSARIATTARYAGQALIAAVLLLECSDIEHYTTLKREWRDRLRIAAAELPANLPPLPILLFAPGPDESRSLRELDGMLLAQERGWATMNGYSGNTPPNHILTGDCRDPAVDLSAALDFLGRNGNEEFERLAKRVVAVGYTGCDPSWVSRRLQLNAFAGPLPAELMAATTISIDHVRIGDGFPQATIMIHNHGSRAIPATSSTAMPIRLSARYFPVAGLTTNILRTPGRDFLQPLDTDVVCLPHRCDFIR